MHIKCTLHVLEHVQAMSAHYMYKQKHNQCAFHGLVHVHEIDMDTYLKIAATLYLQAI